MRSHVSNPKEGLNRFRIRVRIEKEDTYISRDVPTVETKEPSLILKGILTPSLTGTTTSYSYDTCFDEGTKL